MSDNNDSQSLLDLVETVRDVVEYLRATAPVPADGSVPALPEMRVQTSEVEDDLQQLQDAILQLGQLRVTGTDPILVSQTEDGFKIGLVPSPPAQGSCVPRQTCLVKVTDYDDDAKTYTVIEVNLEGDEVGDVIEGVENIMERDGSGPLYGTGDVTTVFIDPAGDPYLDSGRDALIEVAGIAVTKQAHPDNDYPGLYALSVDYTGNQTATVDGQWYPAQGNPNDQRYVPPYYLITASSGTFKPQHVGAVISFANAPSASINISQWISSTVVKVHGPLNVEVVAAGFASGAGGIVTAAGSVFTASMVGKKFSCPSIADATVTGYISATQIEISDATNFSGEPFTVDTTRFSDTTATYGNGCIGDDEWLWVKFTRAVPVVNSSRFWMMVGIACDLFLTGTRVDILGAGCQADYVIDDFSVDRTLLASGTAACTDGTVECGEPGVFTEDMVGCLFICGSAGESTIVDYIDERHVEIDFSGGFCEQSFEVKAKTITWNTSPTNNIDYVGEASVEAQGEHWELDSSTPREERMSNGGLMSPDGPTWAWYPCASPVTGVVIRLCSLGVSATVNSGSTGSLIFYPVKSARTRP